MVFGWAQLRHIQGMDKPIGIALAARGLLAAALCLVPQSWGSYTNFEVAHVHPIALTSDGSRLLVLNTPDAMLEIFGVASDGALSHQVAIPVGLEPVSLALRNDQEAWVVNQLSDSVSRVDLVQHRVVQTIPVGDEPTDVAFHGTRAFVSIAQLDRVEVFDLTDLSAAPTLVPIPGRKPRALAVSGNQVHVVVLFAGNQTTIINERSAFGVASNLDPTRLDALGLNPIGCDGPPPPYPPLPAGIVRNPALTDPPSGIPQVGLIVKWDDVDQQWEDETGQDWSHCVPYRMPDRDLFSIDATTLALTSVSGLGTSLFDVSVHPTNGKIYVPNTEARNDVRFEHPLGLEGHVVDNRMSIVTPGAPASLQILELNDHIDRNSDPETNLAEREASISQPGMMAWRADGSHAYLTAIGSRKLFRLDGACLADDCLFGANRAAPVAVAVGEGPTGVALAETIERAFVLNRIDHSIATVDTQAMTLLTTTPLHDPSPPETREGRRFLYDGIISSAHGDSSCASCHLFGDRDDLSWDLGNPEGEFVSYFEDDDNVRFIIPAGGTAVECDPSICAAHQGFDPQKGPMATQTFRGMLEPLHWRGDRATMNDFNAAFVDLMGTANRASGADKRGLSVEEMEAFRQFALRITYMPNPYRNLDDSLPNAALPVAGNDFLGNPFVGEVIFNTAATDAGQPCVSCHQLPFGSAGGQLGGVEPTQPASPATTALFNGTADQVAHNDLEVPHMRNMYEKRGPIFGELNSGEPLPETISGFGVTHDGGEPGWGTFFSFNVFTMTPQQVRDVSAFVNAFPTGTKPAVGHQLTVPAGTPPTASPEIEAELQTLLALGDLADDQRHCDLVVSVNVGGLQRRAFYRDGLWTSDLAGDVLRTTTEVRETVLEPLTFSCAPIGSGERLGADRDLDGFYNFSDCAEAAPGAWLTPQVVDGLRLGRADASTAELAWDEQATAVGGDVRYAVVAGFLDELNADGLVQASACLAGGLEDPTLQDADTIPVGRARYYLVSAEHACGNGGYGVGRESIAGLSCGP